MPPPVPPQQPQQEPGVPASIMQGYMQALMMLRNLLSGSNPSQPPTGESPPPNPSEVQKTQELADMIYQRRGRD